MKGISEIDRPGLATASFAAYRKEFIGIFRTILQRQRNATLSEAAFPAYSTSNPLAAFLFWSRVRVAMRFVSRRPSWNRVLDFGCGGGVMLPFLCSHARRVVAADVELSPLQLVKDHITLGNHLQVLDLKENSLDCLEASTFDLILALDVLEHVHDLDDTLARFSRLLMPTGMLLFSGPTENLLYRLGRRLMGRTYTGDYHVRNIEDIQRAARKYLLVRRHPGYFFLSPLFKFYEAQRTISITTQPRVLAPTN